MEPTRPKVSKPTVFGNVKSGNFWVEYPSGLIDITTKHPITSGSENEEPELKPEELEFAVQGDRRIRLSPEKTAVVVIDMQK